MQQLGAENMFNLKSLAKSLAGQADSLKAAAAAGAADDDVPDLVENFDEASAKDEVPPLVESK